jgi:hypothetical protein
VSDKAVKHAPLSSHFSAPSSALSERKGPPEPDKPIPLMFDHYCQEKRTLRYLNRYYDDFHNEWTIVIL